MIGQYPSDCLTNRVCIVRRWLEAFSDVEDSPFWLFSWIDASTNSVVIRLTWGTVETALFWPTVSAFWARYQASFGFSVIFPRSSAHCIRLGNNLLSLLPHRGMFDSPPTYHRWIATANLDTHWPEMPTSCVCWMVSTKEMVR